MADIIPVTKQLGVSGFQKVSLQIVKCLHSLSRLTRLRNRSGASEIVFLIVQRVNCDETELQRNGAKEP